MFPTVVSSEIERALLDYLRTTFHLRDQGLEAALFRFLRDDETGMFRGPYLDVRLPFKKAREDWEQTSPLDYGPAFVPYAHQLRAFQRLSARERKPENTLVTTGTGSGKTECFLFPVLDHCRRASQRGELGIKAIILYPMNALASDQAERLAKLIGGTGVSAGLYVGGKGKHSVSGPTHLVDDREILRTSPPDILLTNYRMLDFLLMRPEDASLWGRNEPTTLQYLVLDELHTYDGAQGSDVACLIRRLKARLEIPSDHLCCVGTSATIGSGAAEDPGKLLAEFASKIFAEPFSADSLIGEERLAPEQAFSSFEIEVEYPYPFDGETEQKLQPSSDVGHERYIAAQRELWFGGKPLGPALLAMDLGAHPFMTKLLRALSGRERRSGPRHVREVMAAIAAEDAAFAELSREGRWLVLSSFVSLIAYARSPDSADRTQPFLQVQLQLWIREVHGLLRRVGGDGLRFAWQDELKPEEGGRWLPMLYCRECGFDAFAATLREGEDKLRAAPGEIGEVFLHKGNRGRVIEILAKDAGPVVASDDQAELLQNYLCPRCLKVGLESRCRCTAQGTDNLPIRLHPGRDEERKPAPLHGCPACQTEDGLGFLASRAATLSSVAVSELFSTRFNADKKLLAFTDSVQDASHRAGFFAARTFRFTMRTVIQALVEHAPTPVRLDEFAKRLLDHWSALLKEEGAAALLLPPDLVEDPAYVDYFGLEKSAELSESHKPSSAQRRALRELLETRISWEVTREFGLAVGFGRSLDVTVSSTLGFDEERLEAAATELVMHLREHHRGSLRADPDLDSTRHYLAGLLQRLRLRGGIFHPLLMPFARHDSRYLLSKRKNPHLSRFGRHSQVPSFWLQGEASEKSNYQALHSAPKARSWYRVWTSRALGLVKEQDASVNQMLDRAVRTLREHGLVQQIEDAKGRAVFGIAPSSVFVTGSVARVRCRACGHKLTLSRTSAARFATRSCLGFACKIGSYALDSTPEAAESYYQRLYKSGRATRVFTGEHTGLLGREAREALERSFKRGTRPDAPNLLTCTPTLEMGIDIGDLSSVMLCSVPPLPSNYVQRVGRAGRLTGNATILAIANRKPHDRYFFEEPYEMLRGEIAPPGCFLDAPEMLARQLLAHALDCWAKERERGHGAVIPARMQLLRVNANDPFPGQFWGYYQENKTRLTSEFLALFGNEISAVNVQGLGQLASGQGLAGPMKQAFVGVKEQIKEYSEQLKNLRARITELQEDPSRASLVQDEASEKPIADAEAELSELRDTEHAYKRLRGELENKYPLNVLSDAGVIPNYAFPEPGVTLSALLREPYDENAGPKSQGKKVEYLRAASQAIREFAPFNTFYAEGHKIRVSQLDLGNRAAAIECWRLCRACHYMALEQADAPVAPKCPRCEDPNWSDLGQRRSLVRFRRALSVMNRLEASTAEDTEERDRESYRVVELIDVDPNQNCSGARLVQRPDLVFGIELLQKQLLREVNFGRRMDVAKSSTLAGEDVPQRGFLVCKLCGKVSESEAKAIHTPICGVRRKNEKPAFERIFLYREFRSEAIRLLLPVSELEDAGLLHSFKAALLLGLRKKFLGNPDHLAITLVKEPRAGELRRFLVVYDTVPGGTGYLADLWKHDGILDVLERARDAMQTCRCAQDETKDGCYRCLFAYQQSHEISYVSRVQAIRSIDAILAARGDLQDVDTLSNAPIDSLTESELERKFLAALQARADLPGHAWTPTQQGGKPCHVLKTPNSEWLIEPQVNVGAEVGVYRPSCPDFMLRCLSSQEERAIAVFCDGLRYHVCPEDEVSRLGDDIGKRRALLESGQFRVWSVTWKDLVDGAGIATLLTRVQRELYFQFFSQDSSAQWMRDDTLRGRSSFELLWEYLEAPNAEVWTATAKRFAASMLQVKPPWSAESIHAEQEALRSSPKRLASRLAEAKGDHGVPKRWAGLDARQNAVLMFQIASTAVKKGAFEEGDLTLRLFDDADARREPEFEESWRAFLHAWNVLQFHAQPPEVVSTEFLREGLEETDVSSIPPPRRRPSSRAPEAELDPYERFAREFADAAHILELAEGLRRENLPLPVDVAELAVSNELEGLLAWPEEKVVLVQDATEADLNRWRTEGWTGVDYDAPSEMILQALRNRAC